MKRFFLMLLMGISVMLSASPPSVDLPVPQFDGQQIQAVCLDKTLTNGCHCNEAFAPEIKVTRMK